MMKLTISPRAIVQGFAGYLEQCAVVIPCVKTSFVLSFFFGTCITVKPLSACGMWIVVATQAQRRWFVIGNSRTGLVSPAIALPLQANSGCLKLVNKCLLGSGKQYSLSKSGP